MITKYGEIDKIGQTLAISLWGVREKWLESLSNYCSVAKIQLNINDEINCMLNAYQALLCSKLISEQKYIDEDLIGEFTKEFIPALFSLGGSKLSKKYWSKYWDSEDANSDFLIDISKLLDKKAYFIHKLILEKELLLPLMTMTLYISCSVFKDEKSQKKLLND